MLSLLSKTIISFPGLGIGEFEIDSIAVSAENLGFLKNIFGDTWRGIAWYGIIITIGIILSALYAIKRAHQEGIETDDILDVILVAVISCVVGARAYYVIFYGDYNSLYDLIAIWNGGLAIYGAVIAGIIALYIMGKIKKISPLVLLDIGASSIILGQAIGRWGNFMNGEAFGYETTLPWRMGIAEPGEAMMYVHPTFLYESIWNFIGFALIWHIYNKKKYNGQVFLTYLAWYGFGRMIIEGLRTDSLWLVDGVIRVSQLVGAVCFVVCTAALVYIRFKRNNKKLEKNNGSNT